jgi:SAM-dependent methyltransferase
LVKALKSGASWYSGTELEALAGATNYYRWILRHFRPYLGKRTIEVGAGIGTFSELLLSETPLDHLIAVEPAHNLFPLLQDRLSRDPRASFVHGDVDKVSVSAGADSIIMVNVLEHVEDTRRLLKALSVRLNQDGHLLLLVPAGPRLFGSLDRVFGHHRRYTKTLLAASLAEVGFRICVLRYFNSVGALTWFVAGRLLKRTTIRRSDVMLYDRLVVPLVSKLEARWAPPCGQSLLAVAERANPPNALK